MPYTFVTKFFLLTPNGICHDKCRPFSTKMVFSSTRLSRHYALLMADTMAIESPSFDNQLLQKMTFCNLSLDMTAKNHRWHHFQTRETVFPTIVDDFMIIPHNIGGLLHWFCSGGPTVAAIMMFCTLDTSCCDTFSDWNRCRDSPYSSFSPQSTFEESSNNRFMVYCWLGQLYEYKTVPMAIAHHGAKLHVSRTNLQAHNQLSKSLETRGSWCIVGLGDCTNIKQHQRQMPSWCKQWKHETCFFFVLNALDSFDVVESGIQKFWLLERWNCMYPGQICKFCESRHN